MKSAQLWRWTVGLLFLGGAIALNYGPAQQDGWVVVGLYAWLFGWYGVMWRKSTPDDYSFYKWLAIVARVALIAAIPNLSDDVYRFIWDGRLALHGINPFDHPPRFYMEQAQLLPGLNAALFVKLNSPDYHTIYPPLAQLTFVTSVWLFPKSIWGATIVLKTIHAALDIGTILLLERIAPRFGLPKRAVLIYALNPLILIELTGNLHFEAGMIFFLALTLWWISNGKWYQSIWGWVGAIGAKLLPLMFLPFLIRRLRWPKWAYWFLLLGAGLLVLFIPLLNAWFLHHLGSSLDLYFRKFEFNASLYFLLRGVGQLLTGYNLIAYLGPALAGLTFFFIIRMAWLEKKPEVARLPVLWLAAISCYLFCSTTVHPWYLAMPVFFAALTNYRFPIVWSALVPLTYLAYLEPSVHLPGWVSWLEYGVVGGYLIWEVFPSLIPLRLQVK
ncbi:MAG: hypothetical protein IPL49_12750 [Saprospirales bacterium]|nr:hypothetical protein [Saprospirales bacterium]